MKLERKKLRKLILEAIDPIKVKTIDPKDYDPPAAFADVSQGIRTHETPKK